MLRCKIVNLLLTVFPFHFWQDILIRSHVQKCDVCMSRAANRDDVKALIIGEKDVQDFQDLWSAIKSGVVTERPVKKAGVSLNRRLAYAAAGVAVVFLAGLLFYNLLFKDGFLYEREAEGKFQINSIRVEERPATPFVYQPIDSDIILVWAEKSM